MMQWKIERSPFPKVRQEHRKVEPGEGRAVLNLWLKWKLCSQSLSSRQNGRKDGLERSPSAADGVGRRNETCHIPRNCLSVDLFDGVLCSHQIAPR